MALKHTPVLFEEVLKNLNIKSGGTYVDLTFGRGGHSAGILQSLGEDGCLIAVDRDPAAIATAQTQAVFQDPRFSIEQLNFSDVTALITKRGLIQQVDGILIDLGVSSPQLDEAERGFSFLHDGPLDMRMDPSSGMSAAQWLNKAEEAELARVFWEYGEERFSRRIARAIAHDVRIEPITRTRELAELIARVSPTREKHKHPATRVFQAIRIFINNELGELGQVLSQCLEVLAVGGRLCVISFHSLEDRMVKRFIQQQVNSDPHPPGMPIKAVEVKPRMRKVGGFIAPSKEELAVNPRARSSKLRVAEKLL